MNIKHALQMVAEAAGSRPQDNPEGDLAPMGTADPIGGASGFNGDTSRPADQHVVGDVADPSGVANSGEGYPDESETKTDIPVVATGVLQSFKEDFTQAIKEGTKFKISLKEDLQGLFEAQELSEEFADQAIEIFESAINGLAKLHVDKVTEYAGNVFEQILDEKVAVMEAEVEAYLTTTVAEWTEQNRVAIEQGIRTEIAESFMVNLKKLLESHYVELPEGKRDLYETAIQKGEEILESYNTEVETNEKLQEEIRELKKEIALRKLTEGMVETQAARVRTLAESIVYTSEESFGKKLKVIKESVAEKAPAPAKTESTLVEDVTGGIQEQTVVEESVDNPIARLAQAMKQLNQ